MIFDPLRRPQSIVSLNAQADRALVRRVVAIAGVGLLLAGASSTAFAAPGDTTDTDTTQANVVVQSDITLTGLTDQFTLTGLPNSTAALTSAVTMNVETNNVAGYTVTVQSASDSLDPADPVANPDVIPIGALSVRETGTTGYTPVSDAAAVTVHSQDERSADGGDAIANDYSVDIPFVNADTYITVLNYVAATL